MEKPKKGKRFDSDYDAKGIADLVQRKKNRAQGGKTIVCVSDRWTLEYDLALSGCAEVMFIAISLAEIAETKGEKLSDSDEKLAKAAAEASWKSLQAAKHTAEKLASIIYQPLYEKKASKAIAAQYTAQLLASGDYGKGDALFKKLPQYLHDALAHLTTRPAAPAVATGSLLPASVAPTVAGTPAGTESGVGVPA